MKHLYYFSLAFLCAWLTASEAHKIVIQISPPRCLSTASLRMWQARGDFTVMNEPFISAFAMQDVSDTVLTESWYYDNVPRTFQDAYQAVMAQAASGPLFFKEISFSLDAYLRDHHELLRNPDVYFIFLMRHPHGAISSLYRGHGRIIDKFSYLAGYQACYKIWQLVDQFGANKPHIVCAEDLYTHPHETAQALCRAVDIPFMEQMLHWDNLGDAFIGKHEWHELKEQELLYAWHKPAITSTCFHEPTKYAVDAEGNPTFAEVRNDTDRAACFSAYDENMIYYQLLLQQKK